MPSTADLLALRKRERANPTPPAVVRDLFADDGGMHPDFKATVLSVSWIAGPWPLRALPRRDWIEMFQSVGYLFNGLRQEAMRPTAPLVLYRGAMHRYRRGLSWTPRESDARIFGGRYRGQPGHVYQITAEPSWFLARNMSLFTGGEYIVDVPKGAVRLADAPAIPDGRTPAPAPERLRVLFVCWGNICRSPMAELLLRRMAEKHGLLVEVASRGIAVLSSASMDPDSLATAARHGLDGARHRTRRFVPADVLSHDLIVVLDRQAVKAVRAVVRPDRTGDIIERPVLNPWHRSEAVHEQAYREVKAVCRELLAIIPARLIERSS